MRVLTCHVCGRCAHTKNIAWITRAYDPVNFMTYYGSFDVNTNCASLTCNSVGQCLLGCLLLW